MQSVLLKASAGSGKTTRLTDEVFHRLSIRGKFIYALTFTRAATTEMRSRIMKKIASEKDMHQMEKLNLIMEAGRVGYSTMDSFFYRLFATSGFAPKMADEREQMVLSSEIESLFCDSLMRRGMGDQLIIAARILRTDPDNLWKPLADDQIVERCLADADRIEDLGVLMKENGVLRNELDALRNKADKLSAMMTPRVNSWVIDALHDYESFVSKTVAKYADLRSYTSLGKKIAWEESPYADLNEIFKKYRRIAEKLSLNKALLRELAVAFVCEIYLDAARTVKNEKGVIFFSDVRKTLLALDGIASSDRPRLMSNYFSLGLDRTEHLLIDEFQDTSEGDIQILFPLIEEILSGPGERGERSFFAVGDWKQMIYGWRGANREALEEALSTYIEDNVIRENSLEFNYRSTPLLISFFNKLVENIFTGKEKTETQKPPDEPSRFEGVTEVELVHLAKNGSSEAPYYPAIVKVLKQKKTEYGCQWGDMAVLALTNNYVQRITSELVREGIGVSEVRGRQLLSSEEGVAVLLFIAGVLSKEGKHLFFENAAKSPVWNGIFGQVENVRDEFAGKFPRPFGIMAVSCAIEILRGKISANILDIWQDEAQSFFSEGGSDVDDFLLRMFNIRFHVKIPEAEKRDNIKVDTIHGTKGLQFKHVFIFWNEDEKEPAFYLPSEKCHVEFTKNELNFWAASGSVIAREILEKHELNLARIRRERANVFYVAATRAIQTLTVFLPERKEGTCKDVHQALLNTFSQFAPEGFKKDICRPSGSPKNVEKLILLNVPEKSNDEPEMYGEIDPALLSASIRAGIMRGERLHRWLAKVIGKSDLPVAGELNDEEYNAVGRFLKRKDVANVMFRPGHLYIEQQISDKNNFGVVDRMIVSDDLITIVDYKSGSMRGLKQKYDEQLKRYTKIMQTIYPSRKVEYYILSIDN
ncbi:MAG: DNA helicase II [Deltaproteobacteria bacterium ADurb.Bin151]|jgi:ATP-dependent exoDNAse (exonuclease V) beta subunit|nr:UvrD-helicase domain-containing protein [Smithella sp.]OQB56216.1 MAG: DNA helicase II [Deltaproteobacteria bacterium ADurb.Bin151]HNZ10136.1 UvrD-helicase domain-containing protein [Smithellaceae bacterium]HOG80880.1 UvrD-helicase domain-containing protein [Smithellaceae bacterium]HOQ40691.1 UvrD-helicase domain-containing protein [Smithellaceae bacterium]